MIVISPNLNNRSLFLFEVTSLIFSVLVKFICWEPSRDEMISVMFVWFAGILQGVFWGLGNGGGTMISGVLIEMFGLTNTFRAFAIGGAAVLAILIFAQHTASCLEHQQEQRPNYELLSDGEKSKSEEPKEVLDEEDQRLPKIIKSDEPM